MKQNEINRDSADAPLPPRCTWPWQGISIGVRDHSPGVPEADVSRLAEPFFRPDAARTRAQGGVGLGLHLCKLVALAHGARFQCATPGPGWR